MEPETQASPVNAGKRKLTWPHMPLEVVVLLELLAVLSWVQR